MSAGSSSSLKTVENGEKNFYAVLTFEAWESFFMPIFFLKRKKNQKLSDYDTIS